MAAATLEDESLENWLNKATNPLIKEEDWEAIVGFCDQVNKELEGPQTAVRLLIHKIQSPQEKESLFALTTLEACVKNCGRRFQQEIGKFRFINEIIKVVSPKYLGNHMSERVKKKCIELLYSWSQVLIHEPKIKEAYQMLRRQGIVKQDPFFIDQTLESAPLPPPPPPPRNSIFEDEEKSKLLSRLLRSKNPEDLQAANRLIKNMVKQDAERTEKVSRRVHQLETVSNNVKLLSEMLNNHQPESSTESDREIMKELYDNLEKQRPNLFRLASDTDERDSSGISDILKANDEVVQVMELYSKIIRDLTVTNLLEPPAKAEKQSFIKDLEFLSATSHVKFDSQSSSLVDEQLLSLGLENSGTSNGLLTETHGQNNELEDIFGPVISADGMSSSVPLDLMNISKGATNSTLDFISVTPAFNMPSLSSSISASSFGTAKTSFPCIGISINTGLDAPIIPLSNSEKVDLISTTRNSSQGATGPPPLSTFSKSVTGVMSSDLADLFKPLSTAPDSNSSLFRSENGVVTASELSTVKATSGTVDYISELSQSLMSQSLQKSGLKPYQPAPPVQKIPLNQITKTAPAVVNVVTSSSCISLSAPHSASTLPLSISPIPTPPPSLTSTPHRHIDTTGVIDAPNTAKPLTDIFVPLETIQPGTRSPLIAYEKNDLKIVFHFGKDQPQPDVEVIVVSAMSNCQNAIKNFNFQAAVPKMMKIQLQTASGTDLPAYNPILPQTAITQVMLISHPPHEKIRLKFRITYSLNEAIITDVGEMEDIPIE